MTITEKEKINAAKEELESYLKLQDEIDAANRKSEEIRARATKTTSNFTGLPGGGETIPAAQDMVEQLEELAVETGKSVKALYEQGCRIMRRFQLVRNQTYRILLWEHYIEGKTYKAICMSAGRKGTLYYSYDRIRHMASKALLAYAAAMAEDKVDTP